MFVGFREVCTNFVLEFAINIILYKDREIEVRCRRVTEKVSDEKISNRTFKKIRNKDKMSGENVRSLLRKSLLVSDLEEFLYKNMVSKIIWVY